MDTEQNNFIQNNLKELAVIIRNMEQIKQLDDDVLTLKTSLNIIWNLQQRNERQASEIKYLRESNGMCMYYLNLKNNSGIKRFDVFLMILTVFILGTMILSSIVIK